MCVAIARAVATGTSTDLFAGAQSVSSAAAALYHRG